MSALVFDDVHAEYGPYKALNGVTVSVGDGESVAVLGRNGAGKSTFVRVASGLVPVASGALDVLGRRVSRIAPHVLARMGVVHLPEGVGLFAGLTIEENLALRVGGSSRSVRRRRLATALASLNPDLRERRRTKAGQLSGGQQRLVAVTAALAAEPKLLLCDEPGLGLAPAAGHAVYVELGRARDLGCTLVVIETRLDRVEGLCSRAIVLDKGVITYDASSENASAILRAVLGTRIEN